MRRRIFSKPIASARARGRGRTAGGLLARTAAALALACAACREHSATWQREINAPDVRRFAGTWHLLMTRDADSARGDLALTVNIDGDAPNWWRAPPMFYGSYAMSFARLGLGIVDPDVIPVATARIHGDSAWLDLTISDASISLAGRMAADSSVAGVWYIASRARSTGSGAFLMTRR